MKILKHRDILQKNISNEKNLSFIPTMGGLHEGHKKMIKMAKKRFKTVLVSIYVNPKQFNSKNDFKSYPRNLKKDIQLLKKLKVNYLYLPTYSDIFSFKTKKNIFLHSFSKKLCGKFRPGHFKGVLDVVNRFLEIIKPKYIFLGIKDFQQCYLINKHILKKKINTKVIHCKTIREKNGVACSTRNNNLNKNQFKIASNVFRYLKRIKKLAQKKISNFKIIKIKNDLIKLGIKKIDYIELYNLKTFKRPKNKREKFKIFIAFYINKTRLIDNI